MIKPSIGSVRIDEMEATFKWSCIVGLFSVPILSFLSFSHNSSPNVFSPFSLYWQLFVSVFQFGGMPCAKVDSLRCQHHCHVVDDAAFCFCKPGFSLNPDRRTCKRFSGCPQGCYNGAACRSDRCVCRPGFTGASCEVDIDECQLPRSRHGCDFGCRNTYGTYECLCPFGYEQAEQRKTCRRLPSDQNCSPACKNGGVCRDGHCDCIKGYHGKTCEEDVDECAQYEECQHECRNTPGGFYCSCPRGFVLGSDGRSCLDLAKALSKPHLVYRGPGVKGRIRFPALVSAEEPWGEARGWWSKNWGTQQCTRALTTTTTKRQPATHGLRTFRGNPGPENMNSWARGPG